MKRSKLEVFLVGDQPTTCPRCGARTSYTDLGRARQLHTCLDRKCRFKFIGEVESRARRNPAGSPKLDEFTRQYIETALWASTEEDGTPLDKNYDIHDISETTLKGMIEDAKDFQAANWNDIQSDPSTAGHDFWLTRNGHGAGFWDGDWPKVAGKRLTDNAHAYGEAHLYVGDDGLIYAM